jgi:hypothetical protein
MTSGAPTNDIATHSNRSPRYPRCTEPGGNGNQYQKDPINNQFVLRAAVKEQ